MSNYPKSGDTWTQNLRGERFLWDRESSGIIL
jgi:hypothetical protein